MVTLATIQKFVNFNFWMAVKPFKWLKRLGALNMGTEFLLSYDLNKKELYIGI